MKRSISGILAAAMAATFALTSLSTVAAAPVFSPKANFAQSGDVIQVKEKWRRKNFHRRGNTAYYNGHRGYRNHRRGYRQYNGFWFPLGAFAAGAIIGGAIANGNNYNNYNGGGSRHVQWCYDRYRSYRASDNTFQPYHGPRQRCYSPYS